MDLNLPSKCLKRRLRADSNGDLANIDSQAPYGIPIYSLLKDIEAKEQSAERKDAVSHTGPSQRTLQVRKDSGFSQSSQSSKRRKLGQTSILLSEKYRAKSFFDLVGNDDANRQMLRWLTYWKSCVFGTEPTLNDYTDTLGRPLRKILLVNGPPGVGKTTAAHVIAHQAGFTVLEINASDERGASIVNDRIRSAVNSHQVNSKRPICIIADEVEGASEHGFVRSLINMIREDARALVDFNKRKQQSLTSSSSKTNRKGKKVDTLLLRPIIAVCNDVWAPSLRNLRQHSEIVHFQRHTPARLVQRLEQICAREKIRLTSRQLLQIAERNEFDLRACLNALQFGSTTITQQIPGFSDESPLDCAEKTDWSVLVKMQFLSPLPATFNQLESCSDIDRLVASCFTAYHDNSYIDDRLQKPAMIGDFLALADNRRSNDEVKALVPHFFGQIFRSPGLSAQSLFKTGSLVGGKVYGKPPSFYEETKQTKSILESVMKTASSLIRTRISHNIALLDLLPFTVKISNPATRNLLRPEDKERLNMIADAMHNLGVDLRTERLENGAYIHRLEPPIELACVFDKELLLSASSGSYVPRSQLREALHELKRKIKAESRVAVPILSQSLAEMTERSIANMTAGSEIKEKVSDFFRSTVSGEEGPAHQNSEPVSTTKIDKVWVQYIEGFSNAVRKPITWDELFGI